MPLLVRRENIQVGITVHPRNDGTAWVAAINYSPETQRTSYTLSSGSYTRTVLGIADAESIEIEPYGMVILEIRL